MTLRRAMRRGCQRARRGRVAMRRGWQRARRGRSAVWRGLQGVAWRWDAIRRGAAGAVRGGRNRSLFSGQRCVARRDPRQRGQAMAEYAIMVSVLAAALFLPVFPHPDTGEQVNVIMLFVEVFDIYIDSFHAVITMPIP